MIKLTEKFTWLKIAILIAFFCFWIISCSLYTIKGLSKTDNFKPYENDQPYDMITGFQTESIPGCLHRFMENQGDVEIYNHTKWPLFDGDILLFQVTYNLKNQYFTFLNNSIGFEEVIVHQNKLKIQNSDYFKSPLNVPPVYYTILWTENTNTGDYYFKSKTEDGKIFQYHRYWKLDLSKSEIIFIIFDDWKTPDKTIPDWETKAISIILEPVKSPKYVTIKTYNDKCKLFIESK